MFTHVWVCACSVELLGIFMPYKMLPWKERFAMCDLWGELCLMAMVLTECFKLNNDHLCVESKNLKNGQMIITEHIIIYHWTIYSPINTYLNWFKDDQFCFITFTVDWDTLFFLSSLRWLKSQFYRFRISIERNNSFFFWLWSYYYINRSFTSLSIRVTRLFSW